MFNRLLKSEILESGMSRLQDLQKKVESSIEVALAPPLSIDSEPKRLPEPPGEDDVVSLRKQVDTLTAELRDKAKLVADMKATNTSLLEEGQKLSKRLGIFEEKVKEKQRELDAAPKRKPDENVRTIQADQMNLEISRLEKERHDLLASQSSLISENQRLHALYLETQTFLRKPATPLTLPAIPLPDTGPLREEISRLSQTLKVREDAAAAAAVAVAALTAQVGDLQAKLRVSEDLRRVVEAAPAPPEPRPAEPAQPSRWVFPSESAELRGKFDCALQTITRLEDELEESREIRNLLRSQLRAQVLAETSEI